MRYEPGRYGAEELQSRPSDSDGRDCFVWRPLIHARQAVKRLIFDEPGNNVTNITPSELDDRAEVVRPLQPGDLDAFTRFAMALAGEGRRFLKEDLSDPVKVFADYQRETAAVRLAALDGAGEIAGLAGAFAGEGWSSHVAEIRVVVGAAYRGRGVGRALARAALLEAVKLGCSHVYVEVIAAQDALVAMFQDIGFEPEALLVDFVRDSDGENRDLMLLTHRVDVNQARNRLWGMDEVAG